MDIFKANSTLDRAIEGLQTDEIEEIAKVFEGLDDLDEGLDDLDEAKKSKGMLIHCNECGHQFRRKIGPRTYEIKCPKCGSYDTEPAAYFGHTRK